MYVHACGHLTQLYILCRLGPLTTSLCMRMEAKNSYFKRIAQQSNFKNITFSVAKRHQRLVCAILNCEDFFEKAVIKSNRMLCVCVLSFLP